MANFFMPLINFHLLKALRKHIPLPPGPPVPEIRKSGFADYPDLHLKYPEEIRAVIFT